MLPVPARCRRARATNPVDRSQRRARSLVRQDGGGATWLLVQAPAFGSLVSCVEVVAEVRRDLRELDADAVEAAELGPGALPGAGRRLQRPHRLATRAVRLRRSLRSTTAAGGPGCPRPGRPATRRTVADSRRSRRGPEGRARTRTANRTPARRAVPPGSGPVAPSRHRRRRTWRGSARSRTERVSRRIRRACVAPAPCRDVARSVACA